MRKADELGTKAKNNLNIFASREELSLAGIGDMRNVADNSHKLENATKGMYSKIKGSVSKVSHNKVNFDIIKKYIRDIEKRTGRDLPKNQIEMLKKALRSKEYKKCHL